MQIDTIFSFFSSLHPLMQTWATTTTQKAFIV